MPRDASLVPGDLYTLHVRGEPLIPDPEKLPTRMVVFPWGDNESTKGLFRVNEVTLSSLPRNQKITGFERVCIDFNHNTVPGTESYKGEPCEVAAYADVLCVENEGIVYDNIEWTPAGRKFVGEGHYRDLSPAPKKDAQDNVIFLHSVAACRQGAVADLILLYSDHLPKPQPTKTKHTMGENSLPNWTPGSPLDYNAVLCAILGLSPKTTTAPTIHRAVEEWYKTKTGKTVYGEKLRALSACATMMEDEATAAKVRKALGISEDLWNKHAPDHLQSLSANGSMTEDEATAAKVRKALGISEELWNKHIP